MRALCAAFFLLLPGLALADEFPALFRVVGVAADDVLNIRSAPDTQADRIGDFQHDQGGIEVVSTDPTGRWAQVNAGETAGWAAIRFLEREASDGYPLARNLKCFGTEPFWGLGIRQDMTARFSTPEEETLLNIGRMAPSRNRTDRYFLLGQGLVAVIGQSACSDGMSDRQFGLSVDLIVERSEPAPKLLSGCCSLVSD